MSQALTGLTIRTSEICLIFRLRGWDKFTPCSSDVHVGSLSFPQQKYDQCSGVGWGSPSPPLLHLTYQSTAAIMAAAIFINS
jgi:hypothetical protein